MGVIVGAFHSVRVDFENRDLRPGCKLSLGLDRLPEPSMSAARLLQDVLGSASSLWIGLLRRWLAQGWNTAF